jgi:hypothetical protein
MRVSDLRAVLESQKTQLALRRPVDCEAIIGEADEALREQEFQEKRAEELERTLDDVLTAFEHYIRAQGKAGAAQAARDLEEELRYAARLIGHITLDVEDEDDG